MTDDDDDDYTAYEPKPWGAQQRILPRRGFKAAKTGIAMPGLPQIAPTKPAKVKSWRDRPLPKVEQEAAKTIDELWPPVASRIAKTCTKPKQKFLNVAPSTHILQASDIEVISLVPPPARVDDVPTNPINPTLDLPTNPIGAAALSTFEMPSLIPPTPVPAGHALARTSLPELVRIATAWPTKPSVLPDAIWRLRIPIAGALAGVIIAIIYLAAGGSEPRAKAPSLSALAEPMGRNRVPTVTPIDTTMTVTPIEPTITATPILSTTTPTRAEPTRARAKRVGAKRVASAPAKKPAKAAPRKRRVVVDASTPLGQLRPSKLR